MGKSRFFILIGVLLLSLAMVGISLAADNNQNPNLDTSGLPVTSNPIEGETIQAYNGTLDVLYDQTDNPGTNGFPSQDFETAYDVFDSQGADDFTIPSGEQWNIEEVFIAGSASSTVPLVNVFFYEDAAGLPGTEVYSAYGIVPVDVNADLTVTLATPAVLSAGTYWISVQVDMDFDTYGQFFWSTRAVQSGTPYAWRNPGNGFGTGCTSWNYGASICLVGGGVEPDALFRLNGFVVPPSIALSKTVGIDPLVCAATDVITVGAGTEVNYCYTVTNTGGTSLSLHSLYDTELGDILVGFPYDLLPGSSAFLTQTATINATTVNTATWIAFNEIVYDFDDTITYNFEDISGTGTAFSLIDDSVSGALPLGFSFNFYGEGYTSIYASSNGFLTVLPGQPSGCCTGQPIPNPASPNGVIAGWWEDLNPSIGGSFYYQTMGSAPNRYFIVQYTNVPHYGGGNLVTLQYKLFEGSNFIEVHYAAAPSDGGTHSAGVENQAGSVGTQYYRGTSALTTPLAVRYYSGGVATASDVALVNVLFPEIDITPTDLESSQLPDSVVSKVLTISNIGDPLTTLDWMVRESLPTDKLPSSPITASEQSGSQVYEQTGKLDGATPSNGRAPLTGTSAPAPSSPILFPLGTMAYSVEVANGYFTGFDLDVPEVLPNLASFTTPGFPGAGEYVDGFIYIVDDGLLYKLDPTGTIVDTMNITPPPAGYNYTGMAIDPTDGIVYLASCNITTSYLYTIELWSGTVTQIGLITNSPCTIAIAVDGNGDMYSEDIVNDTMLWIDKATGAGTVIGSLGFDANYGQGMGWDQATDTLYLAAFNGGAFQAELRTGDRTTGNTTLVGVLGQTTPGGLVQLPFLAVQNELGCSGDIPWVSVSPTTGTLPGGDSALVNVTFDSTGLVNGVYTGTLCIFSNDPDEGLITVPLELNVGEPDIVVPTTLVMTLDPNEVGVLPFTIGNTGDIYLEWSATVLGDWLSVDPTSGVVNEGTTDTVDAIFDSTGLAPGVYEGTITITSNDPDESPSVIEVTLTVNPFKVYLPLILK